MTVFKDKFTIKVILLFHSHIDKKTQFFLQQGICLAVIDVSIERVRHSYETLR